jgi:hypothetical protein
MPTTGYAQRARRLLDQPTPVHILAACEISEESEESPRTPLELASVEPADFVPLDRAIVSSTAGKHTLADIEVRLARCHARAATPGASLVWRQAVADWTRILAAKQQPIGLAIPIAVRGLNRDKPP